MMFSDAKPHTDRIERLPAGGRDVCAAVEGIIAPATTRKECPSERIAAGCDSHEMIGGVHSDSTRGPRRPISTDNADICGPEMR